MKYMIGVDLGGTNIAAGVIDEEYRIRYKLSLKTPRTNDGKPCPEAIADAVNLLVTQLLDAIDLSCSNISQAGIGVPGSVSTDGIIEDANNIAFYNVPFAAMLKVRSGLDFTLVNDAKAAALGEYFAGSGKNSRTMLMLTIGTGIGGAYIVDGHIDEGCNRASGEIGHMVIDRHGRLCSCGRKGCFEMYASAPALTTDICAAMQQNHTSVLWSYADSKLSNVNPRILFKAVAEKDECAAAILDEYTSLLAIGVTNLINILQPQVLCIGGGVSGAGDLLLQPLRQKVSAAVYSAHSPVQTNIMAASLGNDAGIIGACLYKPF